MSSTQTLPPSTTAPAGFTVDTDDLTSVPTERLEAELCTLSAQLAAVEHRWLRLLAEYDARRGYETWGMISATDWLSWQCGLAPRAARERVRVAGALRQLPQVDAAFAAGELTYSKVRAITRVAEPVTEPLFLDLARFATASQLERVLAAYRRAAPGPDEELATEVDLESPRATRRPPEYWFSWYTDDAGALVVSGRLAPEDGQLLLVALRHMDRPIGTPHTDVGDDHPDAPNGDPSVGRPSRSERAAHALVDLAQRALDADPSADDHDRARVFLDIDITALAPPAGGPDTLATRLASLIDPARVTDPDAARRLTCDSVMARLVHAGSAIIDVGHSTRTVPTALRRALRRRDRHCRFPGCDRHARLHAHHIVHWTAHGPTVAHNLVLLCPYHHRLVHEGGFSISGDADHGLSWHRPDGTALAVRTHPSPPDTDPAALPLLPAAPDLAQRVAGVSGERLHLADTIDACLSTVDALRRRHDGATRSPG